MGSKSQSSTAGESRDPRRTVAIVATLDTKGEEAAYVRDHVAAWGLNTVLIDPGILPEPTVEADISRYEVAQAAGTTLEALLERSEKSYAIARQTEGVVRIVLDLHRRGQRTATQARNPFHRKVSLGIRILTLFKAEILAKRIIYLTRPFDVTGRPDAHMNDVPADGTMAKLAVETRNTGYRRRRNLRQFADAFESLLRQVAVMPLYGLEHLQHLLRPGADIGHSLVNKRQIQIFCRCILHIAFYWPAASLPMQ